MNWATDRCRHVRLCRRRWGNNYGAEVSGPGKWACARTSIFDRAGSTISIALLAVPVRGQRSSTGRAWGQPGKSGTQAMSPAAVGATPTRCAGASGRRPGRHLGGQSIHHAHGHELNGEQQAGARPRDVRAARASGRAKHSRDRFTTSTHAAAVSRSWESAGPADDTVGFAAGG